VAALTEALLKSMRLILFISFPAAIGVVATASLFVRVVLGPEWISIIPVMRLTAVYGAFVSFSAVLNHLWKATGRPDYNTKINVIRLILTAVLIYPATNSFGIVGATLAVTGVYGLQAVPMRIYLIINTTETTYRQLFREVSYPAVASGSMGVILWWVRRNLQLEAMVVELLLLIGIGVVVYAVAVLLLETYFDWGLEDDFRTIITTLRS
jgi:PST family polysaccharide transporter/lipopolysaccharide exporter